MDEKDENYKMFIIYLANELINSDIGEEFKSITKDALKDLKARDPNHDILLKIDSYLSNLLQ